MARSSLSEVVDRLAALEADLLAPTRPSSADVFFEPVSSSAEVAFDYANALVSPTSLLFAPREEMFCVARRDDGRPEVVWDLGGPEQIIFGLRPCDVAAIAYLDHFFLGGDFADSLYAARRGRTRLIALACEAAAHEHCFCSCCESGPVASAGYDIQLSGTRDGYLVEVGSEAGGEIVRGFSDLLRPATAEDVAERDEAASRLHTELSERGNMPAAIRHVTSEAVAEEVWETIGDRCISCGGCSLVCPKCTCFSVVDEVLDDGTISRSRCRDSCRLAGYTREASGVNPRPETSDRGKRFSYHKLSYRYVEQNEVHGCVGCGRCAIVCMGGVAMPQVAQMIRKGI
jgi:formate hydrogenlyase subunit 6/NADH:ubiquinone oxidoreductase subunit I